MMRMMRTVLLRLSCPKCPSPAILIIGLQDERGKSFVEVLRRS